MRYIWKSKKWKDFSRKGMRYVKSTLAALQPEVQCRAVQHIVTNKDPRLTHYLLSDCVCMWAGLVNIRFTNAMPASEASMATTFLHKRISTGTSTRLKHSLLRSQRAIKCTAPLDYDWFLRLFLFALFLQTNDGGCPSTMRNPATVSWASTKRSLTAWTSIFQVRDTMRPHCGKKFRELWIFRTVVHGFRTLLIAAYKFC